jgi:hypothetical protein
MTADALRIYHREWRKKNPDRRKAIKVRYQERREFKVKAHQTYFERARSNYYDKIVRIWAEKALMACIAFKTKNNNCSEDNERRPCAEGSR